MDFTAEQRTTLKKLLAEHQAATERKITVEVTNLEQKISTARQVEESSVIASLRREIQTAAENIKQDLGAQIQTLRAETAAGLGELAENLAGGDDVEKLKERVTKLEKLQNLS